MWWKAWESNPLTCSSQVYTLAGCCITGLPAFLTWLPDLDSNQASRINSPPPSPRLLSGNNLLSRHLGPLQKYGGATWSRTKNVYHEGTDLQSADAHAIASIAPYLVDRRGIEPRLKACKAPVLPLSLPAQILASRQGVGPRPSVLETDVLP